MPKQNHFSLSSIILVCLLSAGFLLASGCFGTESSTTIVLPAANTNTAESVEVFELGSTKNVHQFGDFIFAGQFAAEDIPKIKEAGVTQVISLRKAEELDWDEAKAVNDAGLKHVSVAFQSPSELTDEKISQLRKLLGEADGKTLLHCGSANRVATVWIAHRVLDDGIEVDAAIEEAKTIGLKSEPLTERVVEYIEQEQVKQNSNE